RAERIESQLLQANQRTERAKKWAQRLAEQLRALGVDPDTV
ncbi:Uma2 family endonuclease, partial [Geitlerinema sp. P-1104]|nr:Uma2 family endonuclease [Geitlerinema sp. P-1104]